MSMYMVIMIMFKYEYNVTEQLNSLADITTNFVQLWAYVSHNYPFLFMYIITKIYTCGS